MDDQRRCSSCRLGSIAGSVEAVEDGCLEYGICHGVVTNAGIEAGPDAGVITNGGIVVDKLCGVIKLSQGVLEGSEGVLVIAVV